MSEQNDSLTFVDRTTHVPCPTRPNPGGGTVLCAISDPAHRHMAAHQVPPMTLRVVAGTDIPSALGMVEALAHAAEAAEAAEAGERDE